MYYYDFIDCPKCGTTNRVEFGDMDDMSAPDVEGVECGKCGHKWIFPEILEDSFWHSHDINKLYIKMGKVREI